MSIKNYKNTNGNRIRDFPVSSAMPQPPAPKRAPFIVIIIINSTLKQVRNFINNDYEINKNTHGNISRLTCKGKL